MTYFLAKTDPETYSIEQFAQEKKTTWDGVTNPLAVSFLKKMAPGDLVLIYHSQGEASIAGLAEVIGNSRPDARNPKTWLVDFKYLKTFPEPRVTLKQIKESGLFDDMKLVRQGRLSTMEVPKEFIKWLEKQGLDIK